MSVVTLAEHWRWSSLLGPLAGSQLLRRGIAVWDERWLDRVHEPLSAGDLQALRQSVEGRR